jgi:hypothetical protein
MEEEVRVVAAEWRYGDWVKMQGVECVGFEME